MYELDGLREGPILLGEFDAARDWIAVVRAAIEARIQRYSSAEIRFNLMVGARFCGVAARVGVRRVCGCGCVCGGGGGGAEAGVVRGARRRSYKTGASDSSRVPATRTRALHHCARRVRRCVLREGLRGRTQRARRCALRAGTVGQRRRSGAL